MAQDAHEGWLPPEALREVADALELAPAQVEAVASFYDMLHLEPVGRHIVEVCTNLSCALVGAQQVVEAFERELGVHPGETSEDGAVTLRTIECAGGCGARRWSSSTGATASRCCRTTSPRSSRRCAVATRRDRPSPTRTSAT